MVCAEPELAARLPARSKKFALTPRELKLQTVPVSDDALALDVV